LTNENPLITVVVPTYNVEEYISGCLDSLIYQTYKNLEIIIVDDCCTDGTPGIYARYAEKDPRIKILKHKENKGVQRVLDTGLAAATGYFHSVVSPDDSVDMFYYQRLVERWRETGSDIILGSCCIARMDDGAVSCGRKLTVFPFTLKFALCFNLRPGIVLTQTRRKSQTEANKRVGRRINFGEDIMFRLCDSYFANHISTCPDAVYFYYNDRRSSLVNSTPQEEVRDSIAYIRPIVNQFLKDKKVSLKIDDDVTYLWRWFTASVWDIRPFLESNGSVAASLLKIDYNLWEMGNRMHNGIRALHISHVLRKFIANVVCAFIPSKKLRHKIRSFYTFSAVR